MILNEQEQKVLRILARWYKEGRKDTIGRNKETLQELGLNDSEYDVIMPLMERIGAIDAAHGQSHERNHVALDFEVLPAAEQLVREIDSVFEKEKREIKYKWLRRGEKLLWMVIGAALTLLTIWISGKIGLEN